MTSQASASESSSTNKTVVVLLGNARGGPHAWASMFEHLLNPMGADPALAFGEDSQFPDFLPQRAKYVFKLKVPNVWGDLLDEAAKEAGVSPDGWRKTFAQKQRTGLFGGACLHPGAECHAASGSGAIIFGLRQELLRNHLQSLQSYERVILTRSDYFYMCPHFDVMVTDDSVYAPNGEEYGGITDRTHVFHSGNSARVLRQNDFIVRTGGALRSSNPEGVCMEFFQAEQLKVHKYDRSFVTVIDKGDVSHWGRTSGAVPNQPYLQTKYRDEFIRAMAYCGKSSVAAFTKKHSPLFLDNLTAFLQP